MYSVQVYVVVIPLENCLSTMCRQLDFSAGRYQKLSNSIYCLRLIHDVNKYCLLPNFLTSYDLGGISHVNTS